MRVVIAEDSVLLREGLVRLLADEGIEVVDAVVIFDAVVRKSPNFADGHQWLAESHAAAARATTDPGRAATRRQHFETAVAHFQKFIELDPPRAPTGRFHGPADYRRRFPDGRIGSNPGLATPDKGKRFYDTAVSELAKTYAAFLGENE